MTNSAVILSPAEIDSVGDTIHRTGSLGVSIAQICGSNGAKRTKYVGFILTTVGLGGAIV